MPSTNPGSPGWRPSRRLILASGAVAVVLVAAVFLSSGGSAPVEKPREAAKPALTVSLDTPRREDWP